MSSKHGQIRILIDTNIWISYLIGKTLAELKKVIENSKIEIVVTDVLFSELSSTFRKKHLTKYFKDEKFTNFWEFIRGLIVIIEVEEIPNICRDEDDNYLLALADQIECSFIVTGDKDLLVLEQYKQVKIVRFREFIELYDSLK